ncbi:1-acylglycerol-3-phosphate O-acyltransferase ABHD5-like [Hyalella azteca]|uniref:1-acylglycerol-3-phosphate O-acyltransferase ABHD5-like n=1 Tax=Hyalella azteca TaxID=294128 RepID=A0A979FWM4_HYAAZ|nr:1-acylglycerol-3-phosphate O-acyltransferase ABHD5-like [Hyalella azteca]
MVLHVYAIDILGFGRSSRPKFDSDAVKAEKQFITSIESWRKAMGLDKFILLGHSFGGFLAASYAIKYPERSVGLRHCPSLLQKARPDLTRKFAGLLPNAEEDIPSYLYHCNAQQPSGETAFHSLMSGFGWAKHPMVHRLDSL